MADPRKQIMDLASRLNHAARTNRPIAVLLRINEDIQTAIRAKDAPNARRRAKRFGARLQKTEGLCGKVHDRHVCTLRPNHLGSCFMAGGIPRPKGYG